MKSFIYLYYANFQGISKPLLDCDVINLSFGKIIKRKDKYGVDISNIKTIIDLFKNIENRPQIVLSIGGWGSDGFAYMASSKNFRASFIEEVLKILEENSLDGIDIDWEYPTVSSGHIETLGDIDKANFSLLLKELKEKFALKGYILSAAVATDPKYYEVDQLNKYLDYINIMSYDLDYGAEKTVHLTPLYSSSNTLSSASKAVESFHKLGMAKEKMVIGCAFYVRRLQVESGLNNGLGVKNLTFETKYYKDIDSLLNKEIKVYFDVEAGASYGYDGKYFYSFESLKSIDLKVKFVKQNNLLGVMAWEYSQDTPDFKLLNQINKLR